MVKSILMVIIVPMVMMIKIIDMRINIIDTMIIILMIMTMLMVMIRTYGLDKTFISIIILCWCDYR